MRKYSDDHVVSPEARRLFKRALDIRNRLDDATPAERAELSDLVDEVEKLIGHMPWMVSPFDVDDGEKCPAWHNHPEDWQRAVELRAELCDANQPE